MRRGSLLRSRRLAWAILATSWLSLAAVAAPSASAASLPPQGLYEECAPSNQQQCASELAQIGGGGFQLVLNYTSWYGNAAQIQGYASEAQADGLKLIWPLDYSAWRDPGSANSLASTYKDLAPDCGCSDNAGFIQYAINLVRSLPSTWGYYIGDELDPSQASAVSALAAEVRQLDPAHPLLYVAMGSSPSLSSNLQPFESSANYAGADIYPIGGGGSDSSVGPVASTVAQLAHADGTQPAMVLQAFSWSEYPGTEPGPSSFPTEADMQAMRDEALAESPSMILWYSIYDILRSDNPAGHWHDLVQAAFAPMPVLQPPVSDGQSSSKSSSKKQPGATIASLRHRHRHRRHRRHHRRRHHHRHHRGARHARRTHRAADLIGPLFLYPESLLLF